MSQNDFNVLSKRYQGACQGSKIAFLEATTESIKKALLKTSRTILMAHCELPVQKGHHHRYQLPILNYLSGHQKNSIAYFQNHRLHIAYSHNGGSWNDRRRR